MPVDKKKVQDILSRFSQATLKAAMADRSEIMQAAGWDYDDNGNLVQGDPNAEGPSRLASSLAEIASIPLTDFGGELLLNIPAVQKGLSAAGTLLKRYGPKGRKLTKNVKAAIDAIPDLVEGERMAAVNPELKGYLIKEGVNPEVLTDAALEKLSRGRLLAARESVNNAPGRFVIREAPGEMGYQTYGIYQPGYENLNPHFGKNQVGYIDAAIADGTYGSMPGEPAVGMIENITKQFPNPQSGISRTGYDAIIKDRGSVLSGYHLMEPEKTMHILDKYYPEKEFVGNYGRWGKDWRSAMQDTPVYRLTKPSQDVLIKNADIFSAESISPDGRFIVDFAKDAFHANGGLLLNPYADGGGIHIKPSHRGKLTELKKRTGKTEAELYNDGNPAHKKMVVFARNARKWKHADGGPLSDTIDYTGIATTNHRKYSPEYISYIDTSLANADVPTAKRASILANIIEESGGNPFALDDTGKFYGLLQWADNRYHKTDEKDPYKEIDNQVSHILNTLGNTTDGMSWTHGGTGSGYNSYKDAMNDFDSDDLATAMKGFTLGYVRPTGKLDSYNNRLRVAQQLLDRYNSTPLQKANSMYQRIQKVTGGNRDTMIRLILDAKGKAGFR